MISSADLAAGAWAGNAGCGIAVAADGGFGGAGDPRISPLLQYHKITDTSSYLKIDRKLIPFAYVITAVSTEFTAYPAPAIDRRTCLDTGDALSVLLTCS